MFDFTRARTLASVETSLQRLGLDCIDLVQASRQQHCCGEAWAVGSTQPEEKPPSCPHESSKVCCRFTMWSSVTVCGSWWTTPSPPSGSSRKGHTL